MATHDSQRLKARGMIKDPELKAMVGRKGIPKGQHGQAKVGNDQPPVPLAKGGSASKARAAMERAGKSDESQDVALMKRHNRLMHPGQESKLAKGGKTKKMAMGGAAKVRKGVKPPKKGHMAAYD